MSSRQDAKNIMNFCKKLRSDIIEEQKAPPSYEKTLQLMIKTNYLSFNTEMDINHAIKGIIAQEKEHRKILKDIFDNVCPRMAVHRKGIKEDAFTKMSERWINEKPDPKMKGKRTAWNQVI